MLVALHLLASSRLGKWEVRTHAGHQHNRAIAAIGILTDNPAGPLNTAMLDFFTADPSHRLVIRLCVFADETHHMPSKHIAVLSRPSFAAQPQFQCVAKIVQWIAHATQAFPGCQFVGWADSDTWFNPPRLAAYLTAMNQATRALVLGGIHACDTDGRLTYANVNHRRFQGHWCGAGSLSTGRAYMLATPPWAGSVSAGPLPDLSSRGPRLIPTSNM